MNRKPYNVKTMYRFRNFKNFACAEINLSQPLTVVIGKNGSGKSNLVEAIKLFGFIANGGKIHEITDSGGLQSYTRHHEDCFSLEFFSGKCEYRIDIHTASSRPLIHIKDCRKEPVM